MKLVYSAYDKSGRSFSDTLEAPSLAQASDELRRRGLFVAHLAEAGSLAAPAQPEASTAAGGEVSPGSTSRRLRNLSMFTRQLHILLASGTPLAESLSALQRQMRDRHWVQIVSDIRRRVEEGYSLSGALEAHPHAFDGVYRSLIEAGESSGRLPAMLQRLGQLAQRRLHVYNMVMAALIYPILLLVIAGGVMITLITFVIPRFAELFKTLDVPLPWMTQLLVDLSTFVRGQWWLVLLIMAGCVGGAIAWARSASGRHTLDGLVLRLPKIGSMIQTFITARITRLMGVLLEGKVSILEVLTLARQAARNSRYIKLLEEAEAAVTRGQGVSAAFMESDLISPAVAQAIHNGEQSGQLGMLLMEISDFLDEDNEIILRSLTSVLEPMILIVLGLLVGGMAVSMFTPLFDIASIMQGGGH